MKVSTIPETRERAHYKLLSRLLAGESKSTKKIEHVLKEIVQSLDLGEAGLYWPAGGKVQVFCSTGEGNPTSMPRWDADVLARLGGAKSPEEYMVDPECPNRLLVPLVIESRRNGIFYATHHESASTDDADILVLVSRCLAKHGVVLERIGALHDQQRICQRLQDAALVAGKIAHDFDNIFTGVVGFAEMVQSLLQVGTVPHQYVNEITSAGNRGIQFTQQLHLLSRSGLSRPLPTTISSVLSREEARIRKQSGSNIRLQFFAPSDLPAIALDAGSLQTVMGNLLDNAIEASDVNGVVRVTTALIELSELEAGEFLGAALPGPYVEICVGDEGAGVKDENRKRLFVEPFFTTKVRHRGLGLPIVYRILHAHRGGIRFDSGPGRGAVFQMVLPLAAARSLEPGASTIESTRLSGGLAS